MVHYIKHPRGGRPIAVDYRTGKIKEEHEIWDNPTGKPPEGEPPEKWTPPIPGYEHPPKYLVPKGGGFYGDPNEPADPQDCDGPLGEISPWCGGNPFSYKPLDLDPEVKFDECNVWARFNPVVAFVRIRPITFAYRLPGDCRNEPPKTKKEPEPAAPGKRIYEGFDRDIDPNKKVFAFITNSETNFYTVTNPGYGCGALDGKAFSIVDGWTVTVSNFRCPGDFHTVAGSIVQAPVSCSAVYTPFGTRFKKTIRHPYISSTYCQDEPYQDSLPQELKSANYSSGSYIITYWHDANGNINRWKTNDGQSGVLNSSVVIQYETSVCEPSTAIPLRIYKGSWRAIKALATKTQGVPNNNTNLITYILIKCEYVIGENCSSTKLKDHWPPPPPSPPKDCCMNCAQQNDLLRQILAEAQRARKEAEEANEQATKAREDAAKAADEAKKAADEAKKANEKIGSDEFPATLPEGLSSNKEGTKEIKNLAEFMKQHVIYMDEIIGEVPVKIKIQDSDLLKEGDQPVELTFENLAEMQAEQFGITMNSSINLELLVQLVTKTLTELTVTRKMLHTLQSAHNAMVQYFGYNVKEDFEEVPFSITVPKTDELEEFSIEKFVKESTQKVEISKLDKKEVGAHRKYMLTLQKMAGIINSVFWRKLKGGIDLINQMKSAFTKQHETINDIDKHQDEFEKWLEEYENGFTTTEGYHGDPAKPWGDDYESRPRTKIVGKLDADIQPPTT